MLMRKMRSIKKPEGSVKKGERSLGESEVSTIHQTAGSRRNTPGGKRSGFLLAELVFVMMLMGIIMTVSISTLKPGTFQEHARDIAFMNDFKSALLRHRTQSVREPYFGYVIDLSGQGKAVFFKQGKVQAVFDDPVYRIYHKVGTFSRIVTRWNFKSVTGEPMSNAYTLQIYKSGTLMAELVYQLGTSAFREVYFEGN